MRKVFTEVVVDRPTDEANRYFKSGEQKFDDVIGVMPGTTMTGAARAVVVSVIVIVVPEAGPR